MPGSCWVGRVCSCVLAHRYPNFIVHSFYLLTQNVLVPVATLLPHPQSASLPSCHQSFRQKCLRLQSRTCHTFLRTRCSRFIRLMSWSCMHLRSHRYKGESHECSIKRHEHFLALRLGLQPHHQVWQMCCMLLQHCFPAHSRAVEAALLSGVGALAGHKESHIDTCHT